MVNKDQRMQAQPQESLPAEETERTRSRRVFVPKADIFETENELVLLVDIPGASQKTANITLEKNVLTIEAYSDPVRSGGYDMAYAEYEEGDYRRTFHLSDEIDRDRIEATVSDGVLRLQLPKSEYATTKKIAIKTGSG